MPPIPASPALPASPAIPALPAVHAPQPTTRREAAAANAPGARPPGDGASVSPPTPAPDLWATLDTIAARLAETAVARDRAGGHPAAEKALLRDHGLLTLPIPTAWGGHGLRWSQALAAVRRLARADSAVAHLLAFQYLQVFSVFAYGSHAQQRQWLGDTARHRWWWGNATNPVDTRLRAQAEADGAWRLDGRKGFCSGTRGSDRMLVTALVNDQGDRLYAVVPTARDGITVHDDWDPIGQRQTDSTTVSFDAVRVAPDEVLVLPGVPLRPAQTLRSLFAQLILVNLYLGIAEGALDEARRYLATAGRPWAASGVARAADDPYTLHRAAEMRLAISAGNALARIAEAQLDAAWSRGNALGAEERGALAVQVAEAKVLAHRAALGVSESLFDVCGARGTAAALGLDRYWRNARTHTLHDPVDYKLRDIGRHALEGVLPEPGLYS